MCWPSGHDKIYEPAPDKPTIRLVWPANTQISLYIQPVWQGFLFILLWINRRLKKVHAVSENSDQTARMRRLIFHWSQKSYCRSCRALVQLCYKDDYTHNIYTQHTLSWWNLPKIPLSICLFELSEQFS